MAAAPAKGAGTADLDLQAVEGISRDTLIALLKRKDKDVKALTSKVEKLEDKLVKTVRYNKILMEDRNAFLRFCGELLPESGGVFEEAAAQETPVNLEALLQRLSAWRKALEAAGDDRSVLRCFVELVFPRDEALLRLFDGQSMGLGAFDAIQQKWVAFEELHRKEVAAIDEFSREQLRAKTREVEELREQVTRLAKEKAQSLSMSLRRNAGPPAAGEAAEGQAANEGRTAAATELAEARRQAEQHAQEAQEAREAKAAAERRERESNELLEIQRSEVRTLQEEVERLRDAHEAQLAQVKKLSEQKQQGTASLQQRIAELEKEAGSNSFISRLAEQQAARDTEMKEHAKQMRELSVNLNQAQKQLTLSYEQEGALKRRIRELESSCGRGAVAGDYLKHVVLKYMHYNQRGDIKAQTLVPVLCTLLSLSAEEKSAVEKSAVPAPFLFVNQAVGEAASWFRGDPDSVPGLSSTASAPAEPAAPAGEETGAVAVAG